MNVAVNQMDQDTQQNAAMAEEASAAGKAMQGEATRLQSLLQQFRLGRNETDRALRAELKRAAPHAFSMAAAAASPPLDRSAAVPRKVANGSRSAAGANDWAEF